MIELKALKILLQAKLKYKKHTTKENALIISTALSLEMFALLVIRKDKLKIYNCFNYQK